MSALRPRDVRKVDPMFATRLGARHTCADRVHHPISWADGAAYASSRVKTFYVVREGQEKLCPTFRRTDGSARLE